MGILGEELAQDDVNVIAPHNANAGAVNEPLVDFSVMHDGHDTRAQSPPLTPPLTGHTSLTLERQGSWLSDEERDTKTAPAPPDFTRRGIHIPSRTSSSTPAANKKRMSLQRRLSSDTASFIMPRTPEQHHPRSQSSSHAPTPARRAPSRVNSPEPVALRSSADSVISYESLAPSIATQALGPLQYKSAVDGDDRLSPLLEDDPHSFDLVAPIEDAKKTLGLESQSELLFSKEHLQGIFNDTSLLLQFTTFLTTVRPNSVPVLIYYLDALKALRAINYANAVAEALEPIKSLEFTTNPARPTVNAILEEKADQAFDVLVRDDLPAFITHVFTQVVSVSISKRVTGNLPPMLRDASEGLAEVFCLTDPSRADNPIIFASEEFHRTTQYGVGYVIGRNCRFLQGPKTNRNSVNRLREVLAAGKEHSEVFLNYRRDGSPFMNLLMMAPLLDSRGNLRYFIGAQVDVSGLVKDGSDLDAYQRLLRKQEHDEEPEDSKDEFQELSEMFNHTELDTVRKYGGGMHREHVEEADDASTIHHRPRVLIQDQSTFDDMGEVEKPSPKVEGRLNGPYKNYLLVRPAPSLRILFSSPSLRVPGILQSQFLDRIGGSSRVRASVGNALADGTRGVTAKIRWLSRAIPDLEESQEEGRPRWIHCTPLLGQSGAVGVWMIVLVDEERHGSVSRRFRQAPPIANDVRNLRDMARPSRSRLDDIDDMDFDVPTSRSASRMEGSTRSPAARHLALDAVRRLSNSRNTHPVYGQRATRSASSSIKDYVAGRAASIETFDI
ncbi:hypothetical protein GQ44DRAFT_649836 [Phaeosphaeriaceae sp. PMI808]|nr:hypothetical protein GQ44DRAFT_649836 [Phaeosphaeriaceae sp. PMI808]